MPKITKISPQKNSSYKINVFVDNKFATGIDDITWIEHGFKIGDTITSAQIELLKKQNQFNKAYNSALKLLSYRPQSCLEIKQKLYKKYTSPIISQIIKKLKDRNLINDQEFANLWIKERSKTKLRSRRHLILELQKKGIDKEFISNAIDLIMLDDIEIESATKLLIKKLRQLNTTEVSEKAKIYLARKGFDYRTILAAQEKIKNLEDELIFPDQIL